MVALLIGQYAVAALFGAMVFFPIVVAPTTFKILDAKNAGLFLRALFPGYYAFIIMGSLVGAAGFYQRPLIAALLGAIGLSTLLVRQVLMPKINAWRDQELAGDTGAAKAFALGHRLSVAINMVQLGLLVWIFWLLR
ncbi:MAG: DUF4149 domain-containing protein [Pseudomonadota bacterium]